MKSEYTKSCYRKKHLFQFIHFLILFGPFLYFIPYAYIIGETADKIILSFSVVVCLILTFISFIIDVSHRSSLHKSIFWLALIGILFCLNEIRVFIYIMAFCAIIDELIITRMIEYYRAAGIANKQIDKRGK